MTQQEADEAQNWRGMDGATAWQLIDRHADGWEDIGLMMNAWLRANVAAERDGCAAHLRTAADKLAPKGKRTNQYDRHVADVLNNKADELLARPNVQAQGRAACGASLGAQC